MDPVFNYFVNNDGSISYGYPVTDQTGNVIWKPLLTQEDQAAFAIDFAKKQMEFQEAVNYRNMEMYFRLAEKDREYELKMQLEERKEKAKVRQLEAYEELKTKKELASMTVIQDEDGYFKLKYTYPSGFKGKSVYSNSILPVAHMTMTLVKSHERELVLELIRWDKCSDMAFIMKEEGPSVFVSQLRKAGISFSLHKDHHHQAADLVYSWLRDHATVYTPYDHFGWTMTEKGQWHFVDEDEMTFDDYLKGRWH